MHHVEHEVSEEVNIGDFDKKTIDIDDINAFGEGEASNKYSTLGHELKEQQSGQLGEKKGYPDAHKDGYKAEKQITGFGRAGVAMTSDVSEKNGVVNGRYDNVYIKGDRMVVVSVHVKKNNVIKVTRENVD